MKNTIFILVDSLYYDKTIEQDNHHSPMPFLDKLRSEGLDCTNMYSEAPYTEAALVSTLCGMDTLKYGGYLNKLHGKETLMETFKKNGYDTFCNCSDPFRMYSKESLTDEYFYASFSFYGMWSSRLKYYANIFNTEGLNDKTMSMVVRWLDLYLNFGKDFLEKLKNVDKSVSFILPFIGSENIDDTIEKFNNEYYKFHKDKEGYLKDIFKLGDNHPLFKIKTYSYSNKVEISDKKKLQKRYKGIIIKMFWKNFYMNIKNNKLILVPKSEKKELFKNYLNSIVNRFMLKKISYKYNNIKNIPSMDTTFEFFEKWLLNRKSKKNYFAFFHVDDCHSPEMFYTYDTNDFKKLDEEFDLIKNYVKNVSKNYRGNLSYDVSLQYADLCIKRLYKFLEKNNMLENLNIVVCADHGSSYSFDPYRSNFVNNVHRENYNFPFVLWGKDIKHQVVTDFHNSKDIPATILDINGIKIPKEYDGISIYSKNKRDYVLLENVIGGCPDYNKRDILLGIRNKKYCIVMNVNVHKNFDYATLYAVYDLINDKEELYNLKDTIDKNKIQEELKIIQKEFESLKDDVQKHNFLNC